MFPNEADKKGIIKLEGTDVKMKQQEENADRPEKVVTGSEKNTFPGFPEVRKL